MKFTKRELVKKTKTVKDLSVGVVFSPRGEDKMYMLTDFDGADYLAWAKWYEGGETTAIDRFKDEVEMNRCNGFYVERDDGYYEEHYIVAVNLKCGTAVLLHREVEVDEYDCELIYQEKY